jgi:hypothetical protein
MKQSEMESLKYPISTNYGEGTIHRWARRLGLQMPRRSRFTIREKRTVLQEATRNGTGVTCRAYKIVPGALRYWLRLQGFELIPKAITGIRFVDGENNLTGRLTSNLNKDAPFPDTQVLTISRSGFPGTPCFSTGLIKAQ